MVGGAMAAGSPLGLLGAALSYASDPVKIAQQIHAVQSLSESVGKNLGGGVRGLFTGGTVGSLPYKAARAVAISHRASDNSDQRAAWLRGEADRLRSKTPAMVASATEATIREQVPHAPATAASAGATVARAHAYLQSVVPNTESAHPLGPQPTPSRSAMDKFARVQQAIIDPGSLVADAKEGDISPDAVKAIQAVYPAQYADIVQRAGGEMMKAREQGRDVPYKQRLALGTLIPGSEPTLAPDFIRLMQSVYKAQPAAPPRPDTPQRTARDQERYSLREKEEA
jgi:hypothetical protein